MGHKFTPIEYIKYQKKVCLKVYIKIDSVAKFKFYGSLINLINFMVVDSFIV
jgi:hypothetical protein